MSGDINLSFFPRDVECPFCEHEVPVKRKVNVNILDESGRTAVASFDENTWRRIARHAERILRLDGIQRKQREFRKHKSLRQAGVRLGISSWLCSR